MGKKMSKICFNSQNITTLKDAEISRLKRELQFAHNAALARNREMGLLSIEKAKTLSRLHKAQLVIRSLEDELFAIQRIDA